MNPNLSFELRRKKKGTTPTPLLPPFHGVPTPPLYSVLPAPETAVRNPRPSTFSPSPAAYSTTVTAVTTPPSPSTTMPSCFRLYSSPSPPRFHGRTTASRGGGVNHRVRRPPLVTIATVVLLAADEDVHFPLMEAPTSALHPVLFSSPSSTTSMRF